MSERYKIFSSFDELEDKKQIKFSNFLKFNEFLEREWISSYDKIYDSYMKVLSAWEDINYSDYSELDFQIKYLIEEEKVAVNNILEFAEIKFSDIETMLKDALLESPLFTPINKIWEFIAINKDIEKQIPVVIKDLVKRWKWNLVIITKDPKILSEEWKTFHLIDFDFTNDIVNNLFKFKEKLLDFDLDKEYREHSRLPIWIWVM